MSAEILKEFLVAIGFKVDDALYKKFTKGLGDATKHVVEFAAAVEAAATAVETGVVKMASQFENLYWTGQRLHATVANVQALGFAFSNLGGSKDQAISALKAINDFITTNPAGEGILKGYHVATRDVNGQLRDTSAILGDLKTRWNNMPFWQANVEATQLFGIDSEALRVMLRDTGEFEKIQADMAKRFGLNQDDMAKQSTIFKQHFRVAMLGVEMAMTKVAMALEKPIDNQIQKFLVFLETHGPEIVKVVTDLATRFVNFLTWSAQKAVQLYQFFKNLDSATHGWSTRILEAVAAIKLLGLDHLLIAFLSLARILGFIDIASVFTSGAGALAAFGAALLNPLTWIIAVVAALGLLLFSIKDFRDAVTGAFREAIPQLKQAIGNLMDAFGDLFKALAPVGDAIGKFFGPIAASVLKGTIGSIADQINILAASIRALKDVTSGDWKGAKEALNDINKINQLKALHEAQARGMDVQAQIDKLQGTLTPQTGAKVKDDPKTADPKRKSFGDTMKELWAQITGSTPGKPDPMSQSLAGLAAGTGANDNNIYITDPANPTAGQNGSRDANPLANGGESPNYNAFQTTDSVWTLMLIELKKIHERMDQLVVAITGKPLDDSAVGGSGGGSGGGSSSGDGSGSGSAPSGGTKAERENNPGNLTDGHGIRHFGSALEGASAMARQILIDFNRHGQRTVAALINDPRHGWANENAPGNTHATAMNYISRVAKALGVAANDAINLNDPQTLAKVMQAMAGVETGKKHAFDPATFSVAANNALGGHAQMADAHLKGPSYTMADGSQGDTNVTIHQKTDVHVSGGSDSKSTARDVGAAQRSVNDEILRHAKKVVA